MKFENLNLLPRLIFALRLGFIPTLLALLRRPLQLLKPRSVSRIYMDNVWAGFGDGIDEGMGAHKKDLITPNAYGTVLEIGAAYGHTIGHLDKSKVSRYVALEPNTLMHTKIREKAQTAGFFESDGTLLILSCGAEDTNSILVSLADLSTKGSQAGNNASGQVDVIISVLTLCTIPKPEETIFHLVRDVLKSGGSFLTFEHVLSPRADVAWWQRFWAPIWSTFFDGCQLARPSDILMKDLSFADEDNGQNKSVSAWKEVRTWDLQEADDEALFFHNIGVFIKK